MSTHHAICILFLPEKLCLERKKTGESDTERVTCPWQTPRDHLTIHVHTLFIRFSAQPQISAHPRISARPLPPKKANKNKKKRNSRFIRSVQELEMC